MVINRFEVYLINLDPTVGSEIQKTRPCVVVSPDELNHHIRTVLVAPMTTTGDTLIPLAPRRFARARRARSYSTRSGPWTVSD